MENISSFESRESAIDCLVNELAAGQEMRVEDILCDIIVFAPYGGNESTNLDYLDEVAEMIGISHEEMAEYANKKAKEQFEE